MHIVRALGITFLAYLASMIPILLITGFAYLVMPVFVVLIIFGSGAAIVALLSLIVFLLALLALLMMPYKGTILLEKPGELSDDLRKKAGFLRANNFKYLGIFEDKKRKARALVFLHKSRTVIAQVKESGKQVTPGNIELAAYWKPGHFVVTEQMTDSSIQTNVKRKGKRSISVMLAPDKEVYQSHLGRVKELANTLGNPIQVKSPEHVIQLERASIPYQKEDGAIVISKMLIPVVLKYGLIGMFVTTTVVSFNSLLFGVMVEGMSIFKLSIIGVIILGLMQIVERFLPHDDKKKKEANKKSRLDAEIDDLLADIN